MMVRGQRFVRLGTLALAGIVLTIFVHKYQILSGLSATESNQAGNPEVKPIRTPIGRDIHVDDIDEEIKPTDITDGRSQRPETMLVILTYMRSGSTFTGDLVQRSKEVFYVFEPLWKINHIILDKGKPMYLTKGSGAPLYYLRDTLEAYLTCNVTNVDVESLRQYHLKNSIDTVEYRECVSKDPGLKQIMKCLPLMEKPCRSSRVSAVKTIRFRMRDMTYLMDKYPEVKVIHLIRDPRPTLRSQRNVGEFKWENLTASATKLCTRVNEDLTIAIKMKKKYPERIATIRYEDLVDDTDTMMQEIYDYLDVELTNEIKTYVRNITSADVKCGALCTRRNSTDMTSKWRRKLPYNYVKVVDNVCKPVYEKLGYLPVSDETNLRDLSVPVYTKIQDYDKY